MQNKASGCLPALICSIRISRVIKRLSAVTITPTSGHIGLSKPRMKPVSNSIPYV